MTIRCTMASPNLVAQANTQFSLALFKTLSDDDKTANLFYSPFSISSALAMVMLGARGNTARQMSEDFLRTTRKHYNTELKSVDFEKRNEAARLNINRWVEKQTQGKIKDVLDEGVLDESTRLVLVNAIYFKGDWKKQFPANATRDAPFKLNKNETKVVKMMHLKTELGYTYIREVNCKILEMPYKGMKLSMLIFLPSEIEDSTTGLEKLEKELTYEKFVEWTHPDRMYRGKVEVGLPRFRMEQKYNMKDVLISMGMVDAFDKEKSDFSGMSPADDLLLSEVIHQAFVEVNEEGTEAAAATAVIAVECCARPHITSFYADHPFLFFIRHNPSMSVLFAGRCCSPE